MFEQILPETQVVPRRVTRTHVLYHTKIDPNLVPTPTYCYACKEVVIPEMEHEPKRIAWICPNKIETEVFPAQNPWEHLNDDDYFVMHQGKRLKAGHTSDWSQEVRRRAENKCEMAEVDGHICSGYLSAHHMVYRSEDYNIRKDLANGVALCRSVHDKLHAEPDYEVSVWRYFAEGRRSDAEYLYKYLEKVEQNLALLNLESNREDLDMLETAMIEEDTAVEDIHVI